MRILFYASLLATILSAVWIAVVFGALGICLARGCFSSGSQQWPETLVGVAFTAASVIPLIVPAILAIALLRKRGLSNWPKWTAIGIALLTGAVLIDILLNGGPDRPFYAPPLGAFVVSAVLAIASYPRAPS